MRAAHQPLKCTPLDGVVAVIGCDGSGKSTLTADLVSRLGTSGPVEFVYLGQSSGNIADGIKSLPVIGPALGRFLVRRAERTHQHKTKSPEPAAAIVMVLLSLWRAFKFRRMLALCRRGVVVVTDRYPQAEAPGFYFDGTGLDPALAEGWLVRKLAAREDRLYRWMSSHLPALVIRLNIDAETAHARKPDHKLSMLQKKTEVIPKLKFNGARILNLDGCDPYPQVLESALRAARQALGHTDD